MQISKVLDYRTLKNPEQNPKFPAVRIKQWGVYNQPFASKISELTCAYKICVSTRKITHSGLYIFTIYKIKIESYPMMKLKITTKIG